MSVPLMVFVCLSERKSQEDFPVELASDFYFRTLNLIV